MILAIDVGNTNIVFGAIENGEISKVIHMHTDLTYTTEEYVVKLGQLLNSFGIDARDFEGAIIASVVPPLTESLKKAVRHLTGLEALVVGPGMKTGMNVRIDDPGTLAGDLVVGSVAAIAYYGMSPLTTTSHPERPVQVAANVTEGLTLRAAAENIRNARPKTEGNNARKGGRRR